MSHCPTKQVCMQLWMARQLVSHRVMPLAIGLLLSIANAVAAHPSGSDVDAPMSVRNEPISRAQATAGYALHQTILTGVNELSAKQQQGSLAIGDVAKLGQLHASNEYLARVAGTLKSRGEVAGDDLMLRKQGLSIRIRELVKTLVKLPGFPGQALRATADRTLAEGERQIAAITKMIEQGDAESASMALDKILERLHATTIWFEGTSQGPEKYLPPFVGPRNQADEVMKQKALAQLAIDMNTFIARDRPIIAERMLRLESIAETMKGSGAIALGGETNEGPRLLVKMAQEQSEIQLLITRTMAAASVLALASPDGGNIAQELLDQQASLAEKAKASIAACAVVMVERVEPFDSESLLQAMMTSCGELGAYYSREEIEAMVGPAIPPLLGKIAGLDVNVNSYRERTAELLRWRRRVATAQALHRTGGPYPEINLAVVDASKLEGGRPGLYVASRVGKKSMALRSPAAHTLTRLQAELVGKNVSVPRVFGSGSPTGKLIGQQEDRVYTRLTIYGAPSLDAHVAYLARQLAAESQPPLTIDAAVSLGTARGRCFTRVGGIVQEVTLEALLARLSQLPVASAPIFPLLPSIEPHHAEIHSHVMLRVDLTPTWAHHDCFFTPIP